MHLTHTTNNTIRNICCQQAIKSPCTYKLGSVITKGRRKIMCRGFNDNMRTRYLDKTTCCHEHCKHSPGVELCHTSAQILPVFAPFCSTGQADRKHTK